MPPIVLTPIAVVRNGRTSTADSGWGAVVSSIEMLPEFGAGLEGLADFSHALILFYMEHDPDGETPSLRRRPRSRADMPLLGVFAQRGRMRPNPVGITAVTIVRVEPARLIVRGLDAIDGTPVLDIKPYFPLFDRVDSPRAPEWVARLMRGYFGADE